MTTVERQNNINSGLLGDIYDARELLSESDSPVQATVINYDEELSDRYNAKIWLASFFRLFIGVGPSRFKVFEYYTPIRKRR